jgi:phosphoglycerate dehydrogenase-like enzyme
MITSINKELDLAVRQQYHFSPASSTCAKSMLIALMSAWTTGYRNFDPNRFFNSLGGVRNAYNANKFSHASTFKAELEALLALVVASKLFTFNQEQRAAIWQRELNPTSHPIDYEPYDGEYEATALNRILTRALEIREHNEYDTDFEYDSETWHYI